MRLTEKAGLAAHLQSYKYLTGVIIAQYSAVSVNTKINEVQKAIGLKKRAKENADELLAQKAELEKQKKVLLETAAEKDTILKKKVGTIGNIVHDSVPVEQNEVGQSQVLASMSRLIQSRTSMHFKETGRQKASRLRNATSFPITRSSPVLMATILNVV